ncbi:WYL domain-containing protein [Paenibacillus sp. JX-17]|uniref:WYL domain-containing protein n=1 Tax=Paenibacillus lacisoli TaxID=3064525 RepID=A0ABT9CHT4_9BACL|nr:WYL domain-containing protein [Paenibacillus sp. JX-17]MDO7907168.1 WYL domain-containing protein [Paenibacillus sp. JX-17]
MTDRLIRLMRIITLIQGKPGILARELAERCETSERTIYRDMEALSAMHIPIANMGHGKGYQFISQFSLYPLNWTEEETKAFEDLSLVMDQIQPALPPAFETAYEKLMASRHKSRLDQNVIAKQVSDIFKTGTPAALEEEKTDFLLPIILASLTQQTIRASYHDPSLHKEARPAPRYIDPYYLIPREHRFYLVGFCHEEQEVRTFRVSGLTNVTITNETFRKDYFHFEAFYRNSWSLHHGSGHIHFKIKFSAEAAEYVKNEEMFVRPVITDLPDGSILFEVTLNHDYDFLCWLTKFGPSAEILEPKLYRSSMLKRLEAWTRVYSSGE